MERIPPTGLHNKSCQGCYVNSSVQLLNCCKSFISYLTTIKETDNELLYRLKMLFVDLFKTSYQSVDTFYFLDCYQPQTGDPNEFLSQVFSFCNQTQIFNTIFQSLFHFHQTCECGNHIDMKTNETFFSLYNNGIQRELPELIQNEITREYQCTCGKKLNLIPNIEKYPSYLVFFVYNVDYVNGEMKKQTQSITQHRSITYGKKTYHLQAMITHVNGYYDGHCRCFVNTHKGWFGCDDTNVYQWNGILDSNCNEVVTTFLFKSEDFNDEEVHLNQETIDEYHSFLVKKQHSN